MKIDEVEPIYQCGYCYQKFVDGKLLKYHKRTHKVDCKFCGKVLLHQSLLKNHILNAHGKMKVIKTLNTLNKLFHTPKAKEKKNNKLLTNI